MDIRDFRRILKDIELEKENYVVEYEHIIPIFGKNDIITGIKVIEKNVETSFNGGEDIVERIKEYLVTGEI